VKVYKYVVMVHVYHANRSTTGVVNNLSTKVICRNESDRCCNEILAVACIMKLEIYSTTS